MSFFPVLSKGSSADLDPPSGCFGPWNKAAGSCYQEPVPEKVSDRKHSQWELTGRMEMMETLKLAEGLGCFEIVKKDMVPHKAGITEPTGIHVGKTPIQIEHNKTIYKTESKAEKTGGGRGGECGSS